MKISKFFILIFVVGAGAFGIHSLASHSTSEKNNVVSIAQAQAPVVPEITDNTKILNIVSGDTYGKLMTDAGIGNKMAQEIYQTALPKYDLVKVRVGHNLEFIFDKNTDSLKELVYKIDSENELTVKNSKYFEASSTSAWLAEVSPIAYEVKIVTHQGEVKSSMYAAATESNIDERAIISLADAFQWSIDFAMDPRVGDTFKLVYEERYLDGKYVMPGKLLAGQYVNAGTKSEVYYFEETADNLGYFDEKGNSVQKMFLKAPVEFKYISSVFTTGKRYVAAFDQYTKHRAIDYAATYGTPIRSVGDGVVYVAGRSGNYGNLVRVRHNSTYSTGYGHMSKIAVKNGQHVKQGQVIGYVGSTGYSTGPHVHYEMLKNGALVNAMAEVLPPGQAIKAENQDRFNEELKKMQDLMTASQ